MEVVSLKKEIKKVLKSEMCFVLCQMCHYVSGQAGRRTCREEEEKRTRLSSSHPSTPLSL